MELKPPTSETAVRLREAFRAAGYVTHTVREWAGSEVPLPPYASQHSEFRSRAAGESAFDVLIRWFFLGDTVDAGVANRVLSGPAVNLLGECGLLAEAGDRLAPTALLTPCEDLWIASDLHQQRDSEGGREHVQPMSPVALNLLNFMVRQPTGSALDICSGAGIHAVAAAAFADHVTATDVNARSEAFGNFNAALNGRGNIRCVTGDLFEAVEGERFDLILCNPPFYVSPSVTFAYQDNPLDLDDFCRHIVRTAPGFLAEGGLCQIICEWVDLTDRPWKERLREWFEGTGCDAWVLEANCQLPLTYSRDRLSEHATEDESRVLGEWTTWFSERGVRAVHGGFITLRRRTGDNWVDFSHLHKGLDGPVGDAVLQRLAGRDFLVAHPDATGLLSTKPRISPEVRIKEKLAWADGRWKPESLVLNLDGGIPVSIGIDETVKQVLERFNGHRTVAEVVEGVTGGEPHAVEQARPQILALVRSMIENGCLLP